MEEEGDLKVAKLRTRQQPEVIRFQSIHSSTSSYKYASFRCFRVHSLLKKKFKMSHQAMGNQAPFTSFGTHPTTCFLIFFSVLLHLILFFFLFYFFSYSQYQLLDNFSPPFSYVYLPCNPAYKYPLMRH